MLYSDKTNLHTKTVGWLFVTLEIDAKIIKCVVVCARACVSVPVCSGCVVVVIVVARGGIISIRKLVNLHLYKGSL